MNGSIDRGIGADQLAWQGVLPDGWTRTSPSTMNSGPCRRRGLEDTAICTTGASNGQVETIKIGLVVGGLRKKEPAGLIAHERRCINRSAWRTMSPSAVPKFAGRIRPGARSKSAPFWHASQRRRGPGSTIGELFDREGLTVKRKLRRRSLAVECALCRLRAANDTLVHRLQGLVPDRRRPSVRAVDDHRCLQPLSAALPGAGADRYGTCLAGAGCGVPPSSGCRSTCVLTMARRLPPRRWRAVAAIGQTDQGR